MGLFLRCTKHISVFFSQKKTDINVTNSTSWQTSHNFVTFITIQVWSQPVLLVVPVGKPRMIPWSGADQGGRDAPGAHPPKIWKNMIFWRKIMIFHGFRGEDLNVIFYQNMSNLYNSINRLKEKFHRKTKNIC